MLMNLFALNRSKYNRCRMADTARFCAKGEAVHAVVAILQDWHAKFHEMRDLHDSTDTTRIYFVYKSRHDIHHDQAI